MLFVVDCNYFIVIVYIRLVYRQKVTSYYHIKHKPFVILMVELGGESGKVRVDGIDLKELLLLAILVECYMEVISSCLYVCLTVYSLDVHHAILFRLETALLNELVIDEGNLGTGIDKSGVLLAVSWNAEVYQGDIRLAFQKGNRHMILVLHG